MQIGKNAQKNKFSTVWLLKIPLLLILFNDFKGRIWQLDKKTDTNTDFFKKDYDTGFTWKTKNK